MPSSVIRPFRSTSGFKRVCFCGETPRYCVPGTVYYYCRVHAIETMKRYRRWFRKGGRSRYSAA